MFSTLRDIISALGYIMICVGDIIGASAGGGGGVGVVFHNSSRVYDSTTGTAMSTSKFTSLFSS